MAEPEEHNPLNAITPDFASAIGYVIMYWSALEHELFATLLAVVGVDVAVTGIFVAETSFMQKLDILTALLHYSRRADWHAEWCEIERSINVLRSKRNDVAHGLWGAEKDLSHYLTRIKSRRKLTVSTGRAEIQQIVNLYEAIATQFNALSAFHEKLISENAPDVIKNPVGTPLDLLPSLQSLAQDQARAQKQLRKQADRDRSKARTVGMAPKDD